MQDAAASRAELKNNFLISFFKDKQFQLYPLLPDASFRTYDRIICGSNSFILMNSPPTHYQLEPFIKIGQFLLATGFSAPQIYHTDEVNGFLLLEDFGNTTIAEYLLIKNNPQITLQIYKKIINLLSQLQYTIPPVYLDFYSDELLLQELEIYTDWYIPFKTGKILQHELKAEFWAIWNQIISEQPNIKQSIILRDYHVKNMMLLDRQGVNSIGLLDFQDAIIGSPLYDLVSVLQDARFELSNNFSSKCLDYYLEINPHLDKREAHLSYHILGAQRNSRILGVFAKKAMDDNQPNYLQYIPRVLGYLENNLSHNIMQPLKSWIEQNI